MSNKISVSDITGMIIELRGQRVILDSDLAILYHVPTNKLIEQVKRNIKRFPLDFMFQITEKEYEILRSQFATSSWGGRTYLSYVFTEQMEESNDRA